MPALFDSVICQLPPFDVQILDPLLELAVQITREGREGRRVGTLCTVGDSEVVRVFCHGKLVAEVLPEMWLLSREHSINIEGRTKTRGN